MTNRMKRRIGDPLPADLFAKESVGGQKPDESTPGVRKECCGIYREHGALTNWGVSGPCDDCPDFTGER